MRSLSLSVIRWVSLSRGTVVSSFVPISHPIYAEDPTQISTPPHPGGVRHWRWPKGKNERELTVQETRMIQTCKQAIVSRNFRKLDVEICR